jgi:hypothetical protein
MSENPANPRPSQRNCTAPRCPRQAEVVVRGEDFDGTPYEEYTCGSCGLYLLSAGSECGKPVEMVPLKEPSS